MKSAQAIAEQIEMGDKLGERITASRTTPILQSKLEGCHSKFDGGREGLQRSHDNFSGEEHSS